LYLIENFMRFSAVKNCGNLLRFDKVTAEYKAVSFFSDTVYIHYKNGQWRKLMFDDVSLASEQLYLNNAKTRLYDAVNM